LGATPPRRRSNVPHVLAIVLAGGEGRRLLPLTLDRAKPAVPFGGRYRIIDFVLSNFVNSGILKVKVLTQYKSDSLNTHIARGWRLPAMLDFYVEPVPAQQRRGTDWFKGSADAIFQSLNVITDENPDIVCVFGGDHVYKMDVRKMVDFHIARDAELTVAAIPVPVEESPSFGVIEVDREWRMLSFVEKPSPEDAAQIPGQPGWVLASMGNYIFDTGPLIDQLGHDAEHQHESQHDFGRNILPQMVADRRRIYVYDFSKNEVPGGKPSEPYWRDVGTIDSYWASNLDLVQVTPAFDLYNPRWPIHTWSRPLPPAKFVFADEEHARMGIATDSLVSEGCIISGGRIDRSVLGPMVRVNSFSHVEESILMYGVDVGRHARIRRAIVDKGVHIPPGAAIGLDPDEDRRRFTVSEGGIVVIPKGYRFE
jgi:glucose-1-phosphate adenylyltransferase